MTQGQSRRPPPALLALGVAALGLWPFQNRAIAERQPATLSRFYDPVVVETGRLVGLPDRRISRYRLYALRGDRLVPIPYQFDARDEDDVFILSAAKAETDRFDANDELVFMAKDAGDRIDDATRPAGADAVVEIEASDPLGGETAWVYLAHFRGSAPEPSSERYVTFERETNGMRSALYRGSYVPGTNNFASYRVLPAAGGSGENLFRRVRVILQPTFSLLIGSFSPLLTEKSFTVRIDGIKNGPVRAIRRVRQWLDLGRFFPKALSGTTLTFYYQGFFETPSVFSIPWLPLKALRDFRFIGVTEFSDAALDMVYWDSENREGLRLSSQDPEVVRDRDHEWYVVSGHGGTLMHIFEIPKEWLRWGIARGTLFESPASGNAPSNAGAPETPGPELHTPGYSLLRIPDIQKAGSYHLKMQFFVLRRPYQPGDEVEPLAMTRDSLETRLRRLPDPPDVPPTP